MPEIAEVANIALVLDSATEYRNFRINCVDSKWYNHVVSQPARDSIAENNLVEIRKWESFGKCLIMRAHGRDFQFKLGMTGRFMLASHANETDQKHTIFTLSPESLFDQVILYVDYRKFGKVDLLTAAEEKLFSENALAGYSDGRFVRRSTKMVKPSYKKPKISALLEDGSITGVGNYLANEALGELGLNPFTPFEGIHEYSRAITKIIDVAEESYKNSGFSFNGGYALPDGRHGQYKPKHYKVASRSVFRGRPVYSSYQLEKSL